MAFHTDYIRMIRTGRLDVLAAILGLLLAIGMLPLRLFITDVYIQTLPVMMGLATVLYLLAVRDERHGEIATFSAGVAHLLPNLVVIGSALLVVIAGVTGGRSLLFYDIAAAVGTALFAQILFTDNEEFSTGLLLFQIVLFAMVFRLTALYITPGYIGVDVWSHAVRWSQNILETGTMDQFRADQSKYMASPLYHLLVVGTSMLLDVSVRDSLFLVFGITMPISTLFIYATAMFFVDSRWAVFATAAYATSASVIEWGIHLIPTSLGLVFFLAVFYCLDRMLRIDYRPRDFALVVFFSVAVILTHQVSAFIMLVFTGSGMLAYFALGLGLFDMGQPDWARSPAWESVNLSGLLVFDLGLITFSWALTPWGNQSFLLRIVEYFSRGLFESSDSSAGEISPALMPSPSLLEQVVEYIDVLGFLLLFLITTVGCLYIIRQDNITHATFTSVVATVIMLVFVFGFPIAGVNTFVPGRWYPFVSAPMAVVGAIGLSYLVKNTQPSLMVIVLLLFVVVFPATSVLASDATQDHPAFTDTQTKYSYTHAELSAVFTLGKYSENKQQSWVTDQPYQTVFDRTQSHTAKPGVVEDGRVVGWAERVTTESDGTEMRLNESDTFIYRKYQTNGAAYFALLDNGSSAAWKPKPTFEQVCGGRDVVYDNGDVKMCNTPGG